MLRWKERKWSGHIYLYGVTTVLFFPRLQCYFSGCGIYNIYIYVVMDTLTYLISRFRQKRMSVGDEDVKTEEEQDGEHVK